MSKPLAKADLSEPRQHLIEIMSRLNWGRIQELDVRNGEPILNPRPRIIRDIRLGGGDCVRPEPRKDDFLLRACVIELFEHFNRLRDCRRITIEVRYGLPTRLIFEHLEAEGLV